MGMVGHGREVGMSQGIQIPETEGASIEWRSQAWIAVCDIYPLTDREKQALFLDLQTAKETNGGWEIQNELIARTYEKHLQERSWWHWGEYEYWRGLYFSGLRPTGFNPEPDPYALKPEDDIYEHVKLPTLKKILLAAGIELPKKNITKGVAEIVREDQKLFLEVKRHVCLKVKWQEFRDMLHLVDRRASSLTLAKSAKVHNLPVQLAGYEPRLEKPYLDAALKRNPQLVAPFWPGAPHWCTCPWDRLYANEESGVEPLR